VIGFLRLVATTRGRSSDARIAVICHFRDGKVLSFRGRDRDEVIEELDLPA
jgi:ketosteroid isomerase-like protein